jgi:hypothetical protein
VPVGVLPAATSDPSVVILWEHSRAARAMYQNLPTNMVISTMKMKIAMVRSEHVSKTDGFDKQAGDLVWGDIDVG